MIFSIGILAQIILSVSRGLNNGECIDSLISFITGTSDFSYIERSRYTRILSCEENLPTKIKGDTNDIEKVLGKTGLRDIAVNLENRFSMKMDSFGRLRIVKAIIWCLSNESCQLGDKIFRWSGKTRKEVISAKAISDFWAFLAEALTYCYQIDNKHVENYRFKIVDHIEEIEKAVQTTVAEKAGREPYLLPKSEVDKVFHLESTRSIGKSHICITFHVLDDDGDSFDYSKLKAFISRNIKRYVLSLVKIDELEAAGMEISQQASAEISKAYFSRHYDFSKELGDMLVYSFCEGIKGCPKILTNYEVCKEGLDNEQIGNYGLHFQLRADGLILVMTSSSMRLKLIDAVKECIDRSKIMAEEKSVVKGLISPTLLRQTTDERTALVLTEFILKRDRNTTKYGYTLFIGYSFDRTNGSLREQIEKDMADCIKYLELEIINDSIMAMREIDIYLVPFNNAEEDPKRILREVLGLPKEEN